MRMRRSILAGTAVLFLAAAAAVFLQTAKKESESRQAIDRLFATTLADEHGQHQAMAQWRGKILVVNFWATWCPPCREEMPILSRLQTKHAGNGVQIVGIALDTAENVAQYAAMRPASYPLLTGDANATNLSRLLGNSQLALPYTVVFNRDGVTEMNRLGRFSEAELDSLLEKIVRR